MSQSKRPTEFELIETAFVSDAEFISPLTAVRNGDDASVHEVPKGMELVVSTDTSIAGVHWPEELPLEQAADRAVCSALSDLAAMGAEAVWAWVSVVAPSADALVEIGTGVNAALSRYKVELAGGDTAAASLTSLNITVAGLLPEGTAMCRGRAEAKDEVWMVGKAGFSYLGLKQWMGGMEEGYFKRYFEEITPKLEHGIKLRELGVRCCIDVSDGIVQDARHIARQSGIGMELELSQFPGWEILTHKVGEEVAVRAVCSGGEDYALLFTAARGMGWLDAFATKIGRCREDGDVVMNLNGKPVKIDRSGYNHFG